MLFANEYNVKYCPDASYKIGGVYKVILNKHVKPLLPKKVNKFKMGSVTALVANMIQPVVLDGKVVTSIKLVRVYNAKLSLFLAMNLILDMANPEGYDADSGIKTLDDAVADIKSQHLNWLSLKKLDVFPIFPVASFYYSLFTIYQHRYSALSN